MSINFKAGFNFNPYLNTLKADNTNSIQQDGSVADNNSGITKSKLNEILNTYDTNGNKVLEKTELNAEAASTSLASEENIGEVTFSNFLQALSGTTRQGTLYSGGEVVIQNNGAAATYFDQTNNAVTKTIERTEEGEGESIKYTYTITLYDTPENGATTVRKIESSKEMQASYIENETKKNKSETKVISETIKYSNNRTVTKEVDNGIMTIKDTATPNVTKKVNVNYAGHILNGAKMTTITENDDGTVTVEEYKVNSSGDPVSYKQTKTVSYYNSMDDYNKEDAIPSRVETTEIRGKELVADDGTKTTEIELVANGTKTLTIHDKDQEGNDITMEFKTTYKQSGDSYTPTTTYTQTIEEDGKKTITVKTKTSYPAEGGSISANDFSNVNVSKETVIKNDGEKVETVYTYNSNGNKTGETITTTKGEDKTVERNQYGVSDEGTSILKSKTKTTTESGETTTIKVNYDSDGETIKNGTRTVKTSSGTITQTITPMGRSRVQVQEKDSHGTLLSIKYYALSDFDLTEDKMTPKTGKSAKSETYKASQTYEGNVLTNHITKSNGRDVDITEVGFIGKDPQLKMIKEGDEITYKQLVYNERTSRNEWIVVTEEQYIKITSDLNTNNYELEHYNPALSS